MGYDSSIGLFRGYAERNFHKCECVVFILTQKGEMQGLYPTTPNKRLFTDFRNFHLQWHVEETEVVLSVSSSLTFIILYSSPSDLQSRCIVLFRLDYDAFVDGVLQECYMCEATQEVEATKSLS